MERIKSKEELLEFVIKKYALYNRHFNDTNDEHISKYYLKDFMQDLLLIQNFASSKDANGEGR